MSYIDTFDHEYLGTLGYLPIYHPLVLVSGGAENGEFSCSPNNLVLGGGSGEHPGLVIHKLECLVANFLCEHISDENEQTVGSVAVNWLEEAAWITRSEVLEFCNWTLRDFARLVEMAGSKLHASPLREDQSAEDWLITSLGEFIFYSLPDLNPIPQNILSSVAQIEIHPIMGNVMCPPPGYPVRGGRVVIDGNVKWGVTRWNSMLPGK